MEDRMRDSLRHALGHEAEAPVAQDREGMPKCEGKRRKHERLFGGSQGPSRHRVGPPQVCRLSRACAVTEVDELKYMSYAIEACFHR